MRGPIAAGVFGGIFVLLVALSAFAVLALGRTDPAVPSTPNPTPTEVAQPSLVPSSDPSLTITPPPTSSTSSPEASPSPSEPVGLAVGDRAPPLAMPAVGGNEIDTSLIVDRPIWINFMATWCPPCIDELPVMQRFQRQLEEEMTILVVDIREPEQTVADFMLSLGVDLPVGLDMDGEAQRAWGAYALPVHYWVDTDGRIAAFVFGGAGPEQFIDGIHSVLPNVELQP